MRRLPALVLVTAALAAALPSRGRCDDAEVSPPVAAPDPVAQFGRPVVPVVAPVAGVSPLYDGPLMTGPWPVTPGWFGAAGLDIVDPHLLSKLNGTVGVGGATDTVFVPAANLNWTVSPRFEAGYRFGPLGAEILGAYRFVVGTGSGTLVNPNVPGDVRALRSRLSLNVFDLDYGQHEVTLAPLGDLRWRVGARSNFLYFDSAAVGAAQQQRAGEYFGGAGPHVGLDLWRTIQYPGFALFARLDSAVTFGRQTQTFVETLGPPGAPLAGGASRDSFTQSILSLGGQFGVCWTPPTHPGMKLSTGYTFDRFWQLADINNARSEVWLQGLFLRAEWNY
jgi:hypothetical protein